MIKYNNAGGCYVEGTYLRNAFRWKETVGPWEERPGHFGDVWGYWSDDGLGYLEYLQVIIRIIYCLPTILKCYILNIMESIL